MVNIDQVKTYFLSLQDHICNAITKIDGTSFIEDNWHYKNGTGGGRTRVITGQPTPFR